MRRGTQHARKLPQNINELVQPHQIKTTSTGHLDTGKLRKIKDLQEETRCHSVRSLLRKPKEEPETGRTRSVSPVANVPPVDGKIPLTKFYKLYSKIVVQLEKVKSFTEGKENESENLVDLRRQLQRADEFSIRFSRNNLYEARRIVGEIKQLIVPYPFESLSPAHCTVLCKKVILAFQAVSQALHTYINYVKNPSNLEVPDKINELVLLIADLFLCCEHVSLPPNDAYIKHDAVKICNELIQLLKSKVSVCDYVEYKEADLAKNQVKKTTDDINKTKKFSMYRTKLGPKLKAEVPRKKIAIPCLVGVRGKKSKKEEKKARITHEIYTQKLNPWEGKGFGEKSVKFEGEGQEKAENSEEKKRNLRRPKYVTPREVRSQDDDVETMIQTIGDDEASVCRLSSTSPSSRVEEECSLSKTNFKHLLLETIDELQNADKTEQKITLKKLLNSIQNCSKSSEQSPRSDKVKVFHFLSKDLLEEMENFGREKTEEEEEKPDVVVPDNQPNTPELGVRRLNHVFKSLKVHEGPDGDALRGRVQLRLSEEIMNNALKYKKAFADYRKTNILYKKTLANKPWELVGKVSDTILLDLIKEIALDFQNDALLRRLYLNELLEVMS